MTKALEVTSAPMAGGGLEGAERTHRATVMWSPSLGSPDAIINPVKATADARARDTATNDGYVANAVRVRKDSIVGAEFRLNADPDWTAIPGATDAWAEEFQKVVESRFQLAMESDAKYIDASGINTFTGLIRQAVGVFVMAGESLAVAEWDRSAGRPFRTAIQMVSPDRLSNPNNGPDTKLLRRGIERDFRGKPIIYHIRRGYPYDRYGEGDQWEWRAVPVRKPWGRIQVIHLYDQTLPDQSRGIADLVAVMKDTRMARQFKDVTLQNAIVQATYAAAIESEIPQEAMLTMMGQGSSEDAFNQAMATYLSGLTTFLGGANNIKLDGVMIPHLYPGTKLNVRPVANPGGIGTDFEASLLRYAAAGLDVSYEELARDYSKLNYSSGKLALANLEKSTMSRKRLVADGMANHIYALWLEEEIIAGNIPLPPGAGPELFFQPLMKEAFTRAQWIGAGNGMIDELKETQAALLRIKGGLSTYESELAKLGKDWRRVFAQRAREEGVIKSYDLAFSLDATRPGQGTTQANLQEEPDSEATSDQGDKP